MFTDLHNTSALVHQRQAAMRAEVSRARRIREARAARGASVNPSRYGRLATRLSEIRAHWMPGRPVLIVAAGEQEA